MRDIAASLKNVKDSALQIRMVLAGVANKHKHPFRNPAEDRAAIISSLRAIFDGSMRSVARSGGLYCTKTPAGIYQVLYLIPFREGIKHPAASSGVLTVLLQSAGFQPAFAPRSGELNPQRLNVFQRTDQKGELFYPLQNRLQHSSSNFQEKK